MSWRRYEPDSPLIPSILYHLRDEPKHSPLTSCLRTHLGTLECRLCLTLHVNEGSYLAHTQGKKHQTNLARRAARDNKESTLMIQAPSSAPQVRKKVFVKIGRPGEHRTAYQSAVTKAIRDRFWRDGVMIRC